MTSAGIFSIIICKLTYQEEFRLIVFFNVNKSLKIGLNNAILTFYLAIGLVF